MCSTWTVSDFQKQEACLNPSTLYRLLRKRKYCIYREHTCGHGSWLNSRCACLQSKKRNWGGEKICLLAFLKNWANLSSSILLSESRWHFHHSERIVFMDCGWRLVWWVCGAFGALPVFTPVHGREKDAAAAVGGKEWEGKNFFFLV